MGLDIKGLSKDNLATKVPKSEKYKKSHLIVLHCIIGLWHGKLVELEKAESNCNGWEATNNNH